MQANDFAQMQRNRKIGALTEVIDELLERSHQNPYDAVKDVEGFTQQQWAELAIQCGIHPPSTTTQAQVIAIYRNRVQPPPEDWAL